MKLPKKSQRNRPVVLVRNRIGVCIDVTYTEGNLPPVLSPANEFPELLLPFRGGNVSPGSVVQIYEANHPLPVGEWLGIDDGRPDIGGNSGRGKDAEE